MKHVARGMVAMALLVSAGSAWAHSEHEHGAGTTEPAAENTAQEQALTGEVVDVFCYLSHDTEGLGPKHAGCAKKCIQGGLPVAIKVGEQLYLASMADHTPANQKLADLAGHHVTIHGKVMEKDGQHLIAISQIEHTN